MRLHEPVRTKVNDTTSTQRKQDQITCFKKLFLCSKLRFRWFHFGARNLLFGIDHLSPSEEFRIQSTGTQINFTFVSFHLLNCGHLPIVFKETGEDWNSDHLFGHVASHHLGTEDLHSKTKHVRSFSTQKSCSLPSILFQDPWLLEGRLFAKSRNLSTILWT